MYRKGAIKRSQQQTAVERYLSTADGPASSSTVEHHTQQEQQQPQSQQQQSQQQQSQEQPTLSHHHHHQSQQENHHHDEEADDDWVANGQMMHHKNNHHSQQGSSSTSSSSSSNSSTFFVFMVSILLLIVAGYKKLHQRNFYNDYVQRLEIVQRELDVERHQAITLQRTVQDHREKQFNLIKQKQQNEIQITHISEMNERMKRNIQEYSKKLILEKYGPGPHFVEIKVDFVTNNDPTTTAAVATSKNDDATITENNNNNNDNNNNDFIIVQLAPVDEMPHTVLWFLEQVENKLYDIGHSFHINAPHVILAGPSPTSLHQPMRNMDNNNNNNNNNNNKMNTIIEKFHKRGLDKLLFQEYSKNYPHLPYTVGFAGRPTGGTNFYISLKDNTNAHAPTEPPVVIEKHNSNNNDNGIIIPSSTSSSSNDHHTSNTYDNEEGVVVPDEGDPCFAKVVFGFSVVDRIRCQSTTLNTENNVDDEDGQHHHFMQHEVAIRSMKIIQRN